jgi:N-acetylglucosaminyl-diphospho-decaprenol L-rhamnosyltransferase
MVDVSVSVVSYRTPGLLRDCLSALATEHGHLQIDVSVVDNASGDDSAELVERHFPHVNLIRNAENVGFGAAHNQALRLARGRYLLVLNSDAVMLPGALERMVGYLDQHPDVGVVGPRLLYPDGSPQPSMRQFPSVGTLFMESTQIQRFWPANRVLRRYYAQHRAADAENAVDWLVGACLCVRTAAARDVGLFDERYFMYSDELDWCRRFRAAGWRVVYLPGAEVQHRESASASQDLAARDRRFQASKLAYAERWHGRRVASLLRAYLALEYLGRAAEEVLKFSLGSRRQERGERLRLILGSLQHLVAQRPVR